MDATIGVLCVLIVLSAYFSATETAFSSLNKIRIKNMAAEGNKRAKLVLKLSDKFDNLLTTILVGNNIVNILSSLFPGFLTLRSMYIPERSLWIRN